MKDFILTKLPFGDICVAGDCNFPPRAEALGDLDIDNQCPGVARACDLKPNDVVIDIGAFVGDTAKGFAKYDAEVYAFEPFFDAFVCLQFNTRNYNVHCYNSPAGNGERVKLVYECPGPNYGMRRVVETTEPSCLQTVRIDDLHLPCVKLMKIDCEGSEIPAILGSKKTILKYRPYLFVEVYPDGLRQRGFTPEQLEATIKDLGYNLEMWGEPPRWDWFCTPIV